MHPSNNKAIEQIHSFRTKTLSPFIIFTFSKTENPFINQCVKIKSLLCFLRLEINLCPGIDPRVAIKGYFFETNVV